MKQLKRGNQNQAIVKLGGPKLHLSQNKLV
jgi:hypothetical protein